MATTRAQRIRELFDRVIELPPGKRRGIVETSSADDPSIAREVLELIAASETEAVSLDVDPTAWFRDSTAAASPGSERESGLRNESEGDHTALAGAIIGDFRIIRLLGRGGMSSVYEAEQRSLGRRVALKVLQTWIDRRDARRRFIDEAATLAQLKHPGIAQVIAAGSHEFTGPSGVPDAGHPVLGEFRSLPWIAIELVEDARTIVDATRGKAERDVLTLFALVADAVHHGHQQGYIHRDLKPANILVDREGRPKVIDFGIARVVGPSKGPAVTHAGELIGSPRYMSPEQCDGSIGSVDTRSDVCALGVVLYEALTGQVPRDAPGGSIAAVARAVCEQTPRNPRGINPNLTRDAAQVVLKAIARNPAERYQSAAEFAADLRRVVAKEPILARPRSVGYTLIMLIRRRPVVAALVAVALLGCVAGVAGIGLGLSRERAARREADRTAWLANLNAADAAIRLGDGGAARRRLDAIPAERRGWEWRYLMALADTSTSLWRITEREAGTYVSPSGRWAVCHHAHDADTHADIVDLESRAIVARIEDAMPSGTTIWSNDESLIACSLGKSVRVVSCPAGAEVGRFALPQVGFALGSSFSPDRRLLAVGLAEYAGVMVFDVRSGDTMFRHDSDAWVYSTAFSPDGRLLAWSDGKGVRIVETGTWSTERIVPTSRLTPVEPGGLKFSRDGSLLGVACGLVVDVIDVNAGNVCATLRGHAQRVHSLSFDDAGERLVTTSIDRTVRVWDARSGTPIRTFIGHEAPTGAASFISKPASSGAQVVSVDALNRVRTWSVAVNGPVSSARADDTTAYIAQLEIARDARTLRAVGGTTILTLDLSRELEATVRSVWPGYFLQVVPESDLVLQVDNAGALSCKRGGNGETVWTHAGPMGDVFVSPEGRFAAIVLGSDQIGIVRVADGREIGRTARDEEKYARPVFSPDGEMLATLSHRGPLRLWRTSDAALMVELAGLGERGNGIGWSPDGTLLAFAHAREGVTVLDRRTGKILTQIDGIGGYVWSIAINADKTRMAVGAQDRITHLYELPSGHELLQLREHTGTVMSAAWSPDGRYLFTGGYDKRVFVYDGQRLSSSP